MRNLWTCAILAVAVAALAPTAATAQSAGAFYKGKTLTVIVGYGPGGGFDQYARLLAAYLPRHLPGAPTAIVQNMPGASSVKATKYILKVAPKDGTVVGIPNHNLFFEQILDPNKLGFDMSKFNWIGRLGTRLSVGVVRRASGVHTLADAKKRMIAMAAAGATGGAYMIPAALNHLMGTKFKIVTGYKGQAEMYLALEKGEVDGMATAVWEDLKNGAQSEWVRGGKIDILYAVSSERASDLPSVPTLPELGQTDEQHKLLDVLTAADVIGRAFYVAPGVPSARVAELKRAFDATVKDPALIAEAGKHHIEIDPMSGDKLSAFLNRVAATPKPLVEELKAAVKPAQ